MCNHCPDKRITGYVIYRGSSMIDGAPIVVIAIMHSDNIKTGDMIQTYILRDDMTPSEAARTGADSSQCGGCRFRGTVRVNEYGDLQNVGRTCYVTLWQGPRIVYRSLVAGNYPVITNDTDAIRRLGMGRSVRLGAYGDPAAVPIDVWDALLFYANGHTGYSHQWKAPRLRAVMKYCQASCDTPTDVEKAKDLGFGYFYVSPVGEMIVDADLFHGASLCPASDEAGHMTTCIRCGMCDGTGKIYIGAHGAGARNHRSLPTLN